jgi:hypothetical protein
MTLFWCSSCDLISDSASRRAEAGPPAAGADEVSVEVAGVVDEDVKVDPGWVAGIVDAGVGFAIAGSGALLDDPMDFSSCRGAANDLRSTGFATSSKLESLSLSDWSSSANLDAPAANDCLLSVIDGGGPRDVTGAWESQHDFQGICCKTMA